MDLLESEDLLALKAPRVPEVRLAQRETLVLQELVDQQAASRMLMATSATTPAVTDRLLRGLSSVVERHMQVKQTSAPDVSGCRCNWCL